MIVLIAMISFIFAVLSIIILCHTTDTEKRKRRLVISEICISLFIIVTLISSFSVIMSLQDFNIGPGIQNNDNSYIPIPAISIGFLSWGDLNIKYSTEYSDAYVKVRMGILDESHDTLRIIFDIYLYTSNRSYLLEKARIDKLIIALPVKIEDPNRSFVCYHMNNITTIIKPEQFFNDGQGYTTYYTTFYNKTIPVTFYKLYVFNMENNECSHILFSTEVSTKDNPEFFSAKYLSKKIIFTFQPIPTEIKKLIRPERNFVSIWKYHDLTIKNNSNISIYIDPKFKAKIESKDIPTQRYKYAIKNSQIYPSTIHAIVISFYYRNAPRYATLLTILLIYFIVGSARNISTIPKKICKLNQEDTENILIFDIILFALFLVALVYTLMKY